MLLNSYALKQAWLSLKKRPSFVATVVTTMGTTLGALTCVLTLAYLLILQPLPYPDQDRIYKVDYTKVNTLGVRESNVFNLPSLLHLYRHHDVFEQVSMAYYTQNVVTSLPHQPTIPVTFISPELMDMLSVPMALGRRFDEREALDLEHPVAVINYEIWQNDFNADQDVLKQKISFKGRSYQIVGVTAKNFIEPKVHRHGINTGIWFPWDFHLNPEAEKEWDWSFDILYLFAKLPKGVDANIVEHQITPIMDDLWQTHVQAEGQDKLWSVDMKLILLGEVVLGSSSVVVYFLLAGVFGLMIIATANITNLFASRTAQRQNTLAIHAALGAKKSHLHSSILAESSLLMAASLLLSLVIAAGGFYVMKNYLTGLLPRSEELVINNVTVICALLFSIGAAFAFAFICTRMINYRELNVRLKSSGKGTSVQVSKTVRQALVVSQVAIATVLVFINISLFTAAVEKINAPTGLVLDDIYHTSFSVAAPVFPEGDFVLPIMTELKRKLALLPQVEQVDLSFSPISHWWTHDVIEPRTNEEIRVHIKGIGEHYLSMTGQRLIEGDMFAPADFDDREEDDETAESVIVNDLLAKRLVPDESAIGKSILLGNNLVKIIGVINTIHVPGRNILTHQLYYPNWSTVTKMNIKVKPEQSLNREEVVEVLKSVTSLYALYGLERLTAIADKLLFSQYTTAVTTAVLSIITLFLAGIGLYGILSYGTQMRRFELGTRMAIGAKGKDLVWLIIKENSNVIFLGLMISTIILLGLYIGLGNELSHYINLRLLPLYLLTLVTICALSVLACYWPLRQYIKQPAVYSLRGAE